MSKWQVEIAADVDGRDPATLDINGGSFSLVRQRHGDGQRRGPEPGARAGRAPAAVGGRRPLPLLAGPPDAWPVGRPGYVGPDDVRDRDDRAWWGARPMTASPGRRAPKRADTGMASPGAVLRRAVADRYRASAPIGLDVVTDWVGGAVPAALRGEDLRNLLFGLSRASGWEWRVDHTGPTLEFRRRVGTDRSASVALVEGAAVVDYDLGFDLDARFNELAVVPTDAAYARSRSVVVRDDASIARHGLRQQSEVVSGFVSRAGLATAARARLNQLLQQGDTLTLVTRDEGRVWAGFREGDDVLAVLAGANVRVRARVMVRAYDLEADLLSLSCDVTEEV